MSREFIVQDLSESDLDEEQHEMLLREESRTGRRQLLRATAVVVFGVFAAAIALTVLFSEDPSQMGTHKNPAILGLAGLQPSKPDCAAWAALGDCSKTDWDSCLCRQYTKTCKACSMHEVQEAAQYRSVDLRELDQWFPNLPWAPVNQAPAPTPAPVRPEPTAEQKSKGRLASFLVVGDWGFDQGLHGNVPNNTCQINIAQRMREVYNYLGDVEFIVNVGDSFYPHGVTSKDDPAWDNKWRNIYQGLLDVPWFSVYGNHDYQSDPCACHNDTSVCAQVNGNISNLRYFYMPNTSYFHEYPEYNLEIVGLDLNKYMEGWNQAATMEFDDCRWTPCPQACWDVNERRTQEAWKLWKDRYNHSTSKSMLVFSHYPTDYFNIHKPDFLDDLRDGKRNVLYVGGHRHNLDDVSVTQITPGKSWLVGGGGGWSCDGGDQGFLQVEIGLDYSLKSTPIYYPKDQCCPPPPPSPYTKGCEWLGGDNCVNQDKNACACRSLNAKIAKCKPCEVSSKKSI
mmetsp:Transcript_87440/g.182998  ORF Transcript_87440/g.182998 Transcript_87440/m.182998 type:complete len:510 (-) Transcript_87440:145-1674(-)